MIDICYSPKLVVRVPCAIIEQNGLILAAQRSAFLSFPLKWEFPGGKQEKGENDRQTLIREIREELNVEISILDELPCTPRDQGWREIILVPFVCNLKSIDIKLIEHEQIKWIAPVELRSLDWTEADLSVIESYIVYLSLKS